jgi:alkanesulfonate monooxygenase SsuD/methylene tetrahydromethanopterin reductase-like flavin-dependent oxidoreductase (luciferase family)
MTTLGAVFLPSYPPERLRSVARAADEAGLEELWLWEDCFREGGVSTAAAALAFTERLRVGVGVLPVPLRNVALTAMEIASLTRMFPDRAIIGIGHGVIDWMHQVGAKAASPLTLLREYTDALQALLRGDRLNVDGRYVRLRDVALDWPPEVAPPIHSAASGPKTLRLAGEVADGTILTGGTSPDEVRAAIALINEGRALAGRTDAHSITVYVPVAIGPGAADRLQRDKAYFGIADDAAFGVAGDAAAIADGLEAWIAAGATTVVLQSTADETDPEGFMRFVAEQVRPLVK